MKQQKEIVKLYKKSLKGKCWKLKYSIIDQNALLLYNYKPTKSQPSHIYSLYNAKMSLLSREVKNFKSSIYLRKVIKITLNQTKKNILELAFATEQELNAFTVNLPLKDSSTNLNTPRLSIGDSERCSIFVKSKREALIEKGPETAQSASVQAAKVLECIKISPQQAISFSSLKEVMIKHGLHTKMIGAIPSEEGWIAEMVEYFVVGKIAKNCILEQIYDIYKENSTQKGETPEADLKRMIKSNIVEDSILYVLNNFLSMKENSDTLLFIWKQLIPQQLKSYGITPSTLIDSNGALKYNKMLVIRSIEFSAHFTLEKRDYDYCSTEIFHKGDIKHYSPHIFRSLYRRYKLTPGNPNMLKFDRMTIFENTAEVPHPFDTKASNDQLYYLSIIEYFLNTCRYDVANSACLCYFSNYIRDDHDDDPLNIPVYLALMRMNYRSGEYEIAFELYEKATDCVANSLPPTHPMNVVVHSSIGTLLEERGSLNEAVEYYAKGLRNALKSKGECSEEMINKARVFLKSKIESHCPGSIVLNEIIKSRCSILDCDKENVLNSYLK